jgi:hypothetical protein
LTRINPALSSMSSHLSELASPNLSPVKANVATSG